jgi:hypothetical protein
MLESARDRPSAISINSQKQSTATFTFTWKMVVGTENGPKRAAGCMQLSQADDPIAPLSLNVWLSLSNLFPFGCRWLPPFKVSINNINSDVVSSVDGCGQVVSPVMTTIITTFSDRDWSQLKVRSFYFFLRFVFVM